MKPFFLLPIFFLHNLSFVSLFRKKDGSEELRDPSGGVSWDRKVGFVTVSPRHLGTGLTVVVRVRLEYLPGRDVEQVRSQKLPCKIHATELTFSSAYLLDSRSKLERDLFQKTRGPELTLPVFSLLVRFARITVSGRGSQRTRTKMMMVTRRRTRTRRTKTRRAAVTR